MKRFLSDARHFQIAILSALLALLVIWSDFAPELKVAVLTLLSACIFQAIFIFYAKFRSSEESNSARVARKKNFNTEFTEGTEVITNDKHSVFSVFQKIYCAFGALEDFVSSILRVIKTTDYRSAIISGLSLSLLLKGPLWIYPPAALLAIGSKFLLRIDDKHIFNPANFAIVAALILLPQHAWISPGQWGSAIWLGFLLVCAAYLVLNTARRGDIALFFLGSWAALLFGRALWLGDPLSIPLHNLQSGALLIFAFFMISDPKTTPDHRIGRLIFAFVTAILAYVLQYELQIREGLFYALFVACMATPVLDSMLKSDRYVWGKS